VSAVELLKRVKALPARGRERVLLALLKLDPEKTKRKRTTKRVKWRDVQARARRIFGERTFPNLVLLEREEEAS